MRSFANHRTYEGVARAAWALAQEENEKLERIERLLEAGDSSGALNAMNDFFGHKKPIERVDLYGAEEREQAV